MWVNPIFNVVDLLPYHVPILHDRNTPTPTFSNDIVLAYSLVENFSYSGRIDGAKIQEFSDVLMIIAMMIVMARL